MKNFTIILFIVFLNSLAQSQNFWKQLNGPLGGAGFGIQENSKGEIFVGTYGRNLRMYKTSDGGVSWIKSDSGIVSLYPEFLIRNSKNYL